MPTDSAGPAQPSRSCSSVSAKGALAILDEGRCPVQVSDSPRKRGGGIKETSPGDFQIIEADKAEPR